ncbi:MAG TPA: acetoacetate--CoA ligase [bacterium]|nr:acetoacetate--CoA ligase [bacterium]
MKVPLWEPNERRRREANLTAFIAYLNQTYRAGLATYPEVWAWSVAHLPEFWAAVWAFVGIEASAPYTAVVDDLTRFPGAAWFPGARLNFARHLLRHDDDRPALVFRGEDGRRAALTHRALRREVAHVAAGLRALGIRPGDRVAAYMPNLIETAVAMLAATSVGAVWASCATDLGPAAALDRLGQVEPAVLFTVDGYRYKGQRYDTRPRAQEVAAGLPGLRAVVVVPHLEERPSLGAIPRAVPYAELVGAHSGLPAFAELPFDHPLYIMFSSGTTGKPKCLVQGAGGVLINHLKELVLHTDLRPDDRITYLTTCSWMMWNWLLSALATGATVVLYDGSPLYPDAAAMWRLVEEERLTVFGCSASYLQALMAQGARPGRGHDLASLREISQTGSPLSAAGFEYVYREIKADLHFNSISGGTDINGCFGAGNPISPVYAGELQGPALGMKIECYDEDGRPVRDRPGELVCEAPAPSMPLYFWNDPDGRKYEEAYFTFYPHRRVWRHGDYVTFHSDTGGITFHGRSDTVLKPSGVRIGTAEIYNVVEQIPEIADSLAVGQAWEGDQRIILFVTLAPGQRLTAALQDRIREALRARASPRHVPALILEAPEIPYTLNMKKVESAVMNIINGRPVVNRDALINPQALDYFERIRAQLAADQRRSG